MILTIHLDICNGSNYSFKQKDIHLLLKDISSRKIFVTKDIGTGMHIVGNCRGIYLTATINV